MPFNGLLAFLYLVARHDHTLLESLPSGNNHHQAADAGYHRHKLRTQ